MANKELTLDDINKVLSKMMIILTDLTKQVNTLTDEISKKPRETLMIEDVTKILHKSRSAIYNLVSAHAIPFHKKGKRLYFFHDELIKWIEDSNDHKSALYLELIQKHKICHSKKY